MPKIVHPRRDDPSDRFGLKEPQKTNPPDERLHLALRRQAGELTRHRQYSEAAETLYKIQRLTRLYQRI